MCASAQTLELTSLKSRPFIQSISQQKTQTDSLISYTKQNTDYRLQNAADYTTYLKAQLDTSTFKTIPAYNTHRDAKCGPAPWLEVLTLSVRNLQPIALAVPRLAFSS